MHRNKENPMPEHSSSFDLANDFKAYFHEKVQNIRNNFPDSNPSSMDFDGSDTHDTLNHFRALSDEDILKLLRQSNDKYCELDSMPTPLVKKCANELLPLLKRIVNESLRQGYVPEKCKTAIVRPLLKKPSLDRILKNYRPVSNLNFIGKLIERAVNIQISSHMTTNNSNEKMQSAYKSGHSCETALVKIFNDLLTHLDHNRAVLLTLLDLSAAFDTVDHDILLKRLEITHGISGQALKWIKSYLTGRTTRVCVADAYSDLITLDVGLPQGSQLGPRLYSAYIDLTQPVD